MHIIRQLDWKTVNKIAAGEVVESPKSVVKELAENAIDAGATSVTVEIKEGGISFIRVADNGCGIPKDQVKAAFLRNATSKMDTIEDLERIFSLGFRGEALASIASVAQVELITKTQEEETGTRIEIHGGEIKVMEDVACLEGTTIFVKNLFYNVPARRKFLKKPATESGNVSDFVNKLALGHPEVAFRYINNETTMLHTAGNNDAKTAVFYVYGKEVSVNMLPLSYEKGELKLTGLIGKPELARGNRNYENLFINGRFIKNRIVSAAVEDAYKTRLLVGKFPVFLLNLEISPAQIDVNVHPAKLEVRFKSDDEIYDFFYQAIAKTFGGEVLIPQVKWDKKPQEKILLPVAEQQKLPETAPLEKKEPIFSREQRSAPLGSGKTVDQLLKKQGSTENRIRQGNEDFLVDKIGERKENTSIDDSDKPKGMPQKIVEMVPQEKAFFHSYKIVGQLFQTYWIVEQGDCMYMIDQHAAHERILYEELMNRFREENCVSQRLLTPLMLSLSPLEIETLKDNQKLLEGFGFAFEIFGERMYGLKSVPYLLKEPSGVGFFMEILDLLGQQQVRSVYDMKLLSVATMACKAAVKGHDLLSFQEAEGMIGRLLKLENPFTCPHGRPTIIEMTKYELEKKFKRVQN